MTMSFWIQIVLILSYYRSKLGMLKSAYLAKVSISQQLFFKSLEGACLASWAEKE